MCPDDGFERVHGEEHYALGAVVGKAGMPGIGWRADVGHMQFERQLLGRLLTGSFQQFEKAKLTLRGSSSVGRERR